MNALIADRKLNGFMWGQNPKDFVNTVNVLLALVECRKRMKSRGKWMKWQKKSLKNKTISERIKRKEKERKKGNKLTHTNSNTNIHKIK